MKKTLALNLIQHTVYLVDAKTGEILELRSKELERWAGKNLLGESAYQGRWKKEVGKILKPFLFVKPDDFIHAAGFYSEKLGLKNKKIAEIFERLSSEWVECYIIACRG